VVMPDANRDRKMASLLTSFLVVVESVVCRRARLCMLQQYSLRGLSDD